MKQKILEAVNEMNSVTTFKTFDEIFDIFCDGEIIDMYLNYHGYTHCSKEITELFKTFFIMIPKPDKKLFE